MVKSKTKISKQTERKTNSYLVKTIRSAKKNGKWLRVAEILASPRKNRVNLNLEYIDKNVSEGDKILVSGKVLSQGEISKKIKIVALNFSEKAKEKLLSAKCEVLDIAEEIKKNPEMKDLKILEKKK